MEKSLLREAPYEVGRERVFDLMNRDAGPFTHVVRLNNPEGARMLLQYTPGVRVEGWHQSGTELAALYSWGRVRILFDRFSLCEGEGGTETVTVISAPTLEEQMVVEARMMSAQDAKGLDQDWGGLRGE